MSVRFLYIIVFIFSAPIFCADLLCAQSENDSIVDNKAMTLERKGDDLERREIDIEEDAPYLINNDTSLFIDGEVKGIIRHLDDEMFLPDPQKSIWYALLFPGAGQLYNRKYWKLPIVYGGAVGVGYAISWSGKRHNDLYRGYMDYLDDDPNSKSYEDLLPAGYPSGQTESYIKNELSKFRRYRDLSIVAGVLFYGLTVVDAYVDAQLADFDVSPDLSMKIRPNLDPLYNCNQPAVGCEVQFIF